jgi:amino acid transporter
MVFAACLSYGTMFVSFVALRQRQPDLVRPFRLSYGTATAAAGLVLGSVVFAACVASDPLWSAIGAAMVASLLMYRTVSHRGSP